MKYVRYLALCIVLLSLLSLYSSAVYYVGIGGKKLGILTKPIQSFATLPIWIKEVTTSNEFRNIPPSFLPIEDTLSKINRLYYDLFATNSFWNRENDRWDIRLMNLRTDEVIHEWRINADLLDYSYKPYKFNNCPPFQTVLAGKKSIITHLLYSPYLAKVDSNSNVIWVNDSLIFHHSINYGIDGNIWIPAADHVDGSYVQDLNGDKIPYWENYIVKIDALTGNMLYKKSLTDILEHNNKEGLLYGFDLNDPFHLNDIEPLFTNTKYWNKGDLFLSLRNRNVILLYRPQTDQLLNIVLGPFFHQHDVDILSDSSISIFNNNSIGVYNDPTRTSTHFDPKIPVDSLVSSEIIIYDFESSTFTTYSKDLFINKNIATHTEGLIEWLSNGDVYIESNNQGRIFVVTPNGKVLLEKHFPTMLEGYVYRINWMQTYEDLDSFY